MPLMDTALGITVDFFPAHKFYPALRSALLMRWLKKRTPPPSIAKS